MGPFQIVSIERTMEALKFISHSPEQTQALGKELGKFAREGDIFLLSGDLGTGKTCLTQGIAWGLGVKEYAFSPSFVLIREYHGRLPLYHIDFYRLNSVEEIIDLTLEEYLYGNGICVLEWAEKGITVLPPDNLHISLEYMSNADMDRKVQLQTNGTRYKELIKDITIDLDSWN
ncbi:MAG: tRNA (adenosine(37)-N6)-threonylcarbamoyltransferase complex ATPase subunit type 1 TsaE [Dehalococcoidia bacterium]